MDVDSSATLTTSRSLESYRDLFLTSWIEEDGFTKFMPDNILTDLKYLANLVEKDFRDLVHPTSQKIEVQNLLNLTKNDQAVAIYFQFQSESKSARILRRNFIKIFSVYFASTSPMKNARSIPQRLRLQFSPAMLSVYTDALNCAYSSYRGNEKPKEELLYILNRMCLFGNTTFSCMTLRSMDSDIFGDVIHLKDYATPPKQLTIAANVKHITSRYRLPMVASLRQTSGALASLHVYLHELMECADFWQAEISEAVNRYPNDGLQRFLSDKNYLSSGLHHVNENINSVIGRGDVAPTRAVSMMLNILGSDPLKALPLLSIIKTQNVKNILTSILLVLRMGNVGCPSNAELFNCPIHFPSTEDGKFFASDSDKNKTNSSSNTNSNNNIHSSSKASSNFQNKHADSDSDSETDNKKNQQKPTVIDPSQHCQCNFFNEASSSIPVLNKESPPLRTSFFDAIALLAMTGILDTQTLWMVLGPSENFIKEMFDSIQKRLGSMDTLPDTRDTDACANRSLIRKAQAAVRSAALIEIIPQLSGTEHASWSARVDELAVAQAEKQSQSDASNIDAFVSSISKLKFADICQIFQGAQIPKLEILASFAKFNAGHQLSLLFSNFIKGTLGQSKVNKLDSVLGFVCPNLAQNMTELTSWLSTFSWGFSTDWIHQRTFRAKAALCRIQQSVGGSSDILMSQERVIRSQFLFAVSPDHTSLIDLLPSSTLTLPTVAPPSSSQFAANVAVSLTIFETLKNTRKNLLPRHYPHTFWTGVLLQDHEAFAPPSFASFIKSGTSGVIDTNTATAMAYHAVDRVSRLCDLTTPVALARSPALVTTLMHACAETASLLHEVRTDAIDKKKMDYSAMMDLELPDEDEDDDNTILNKDDTFDDENLANAAKTDLPEDSKDILESILISTCLSTLSLTNNPDCGPLNYLWDVFLSKCDTRYRYKLYSCWEHLYSSSVSLSNVRRLVERAANRHFKSLVAKSSAQSANDGADVVTANLPFVVASLSAANPIPLIELIMRQVGMHSNMVKPFTAALAFLPALVVDILTSKILTQRVGFIHSVEAAVEQRRKRKNNQHCIIEFSSVVDENTAVIEQEKIKNFSSLLGNLFVFSSNKYPSTTASHNSSFSFDIKAILAHATQSTFFLPSSIERYFVSRLLEEATLVSSLPQLTPEQVALLGAGPLLRTAELFAKQGANLSKISTVLNSRRAASVLLDALVRDSNLTQSFFKSLIRAQQTILYSLPSEENQEWPSTRSVHSTSNELLLVIEQLKESIQVVSTNNILKGLNKDQRLSYVHVQKEITPILKKLLPCYDYIVHCCDVPTSWSLIRCLIPPLYYSSAISEIDESKSRGAEVKLGHWPGIILNSDSLLFTQTEEYMGSECVSFFTPCFLFALWRLAVTDLSCPLGVYTKQQDLHNSLLTDRKKILSKEYEKPVKDDKHIFNLEQQIKDLDECETALNEEKIRHRNHVISVTKYLMNLINSVKNGIEQLGPEEEQFAFQYSIKGEEEEEDNSYSDESDEEDEDSLINDMDNETFIGQENTIGNVSIDNSNEVNLQDREQQDYIPKDENSIRNSEETSQAPFNDHYVLNEEKLTHSLHPNLQNEGGFSIKILEENKNDIDKKSKYTRTSISGSKLKKQPHFQIAHPNACRAAELLVTRIFIPRALLSPPDAAAVSSILCLLMHLDSPYLPASTLVRALYSGIAVACCSVGEEEAERLGSLLRVASHAAENLLATRFNSSKSKDSFSSLPVLIPPLRLRSLAGDAPENETSFKHEFTETQQINNDKDDGVCDVEMDLGQKTSGETLIEYASSSMKGLLELDQPAINPDCVLDVMNGIRDEQKRLLSRSGMVFEFSILRAELDACLLLGSHLYEVNLNYGERSRRVVRTLSQALPSFPLFAWSGQILIGLLGSLSKWSTVNQQRDLQVAATSLHTHLFSLHSKALVAHAAQQVNNNILVGGNRTLLTTEYGDATSLNQSSPSTLTTYETLVSIDTKMTPSICGVNLLMPSPTLSRVLDTRASPPPRRLPAAAGPLQSQAWPAVGSKKAKLLVVSASVNHALHECDVSPAVSSAAVCNINSAAAVVNEKDLTLISKNLDMNSSFDEENEDKVFIASDTNILEDIDLHEMLKHVASPSCSPKEAAVLAMMAGDAVDENIDMHDLNLDENEGLPSTSTPSHALRVVVEDITPYGSTSHECRRLLSVEESRALNLIDEKPDDQSDYQEKLQSSNVDGTGVFSE